MNVYVLESLVVEFTLLPVFPAHLASIHSLINYYTVFLWLDVFRSISIGLLISLDYWWTVMGLDEVRVSVCSLNSSCNLYNCLLVAHCVASVLTFNNLLASQVSCNSS